MDILLLSSPWLLSVECIVHNDWVERLTKPLWVEHFVSGRRRRGWKKPGVLWVEFRSLKFLKLSSYPILQFPPQARRNFRPPIESTSTSTRAQHQRTALRQSLGSSCSCFLIYQVINHSEWDRFQSLFISPETCILKTLQWYVTSPLFKICR